MYHSLLSIQYIGIILMLIECAYIFQQRPSKQQVLMLEFTLSATINTIGYLFELQATTKEMALMAVKFTYMGKVYILLCMFIFLLDYCEITYSKWVPRILFCIHSSVIMLVLTCEKNNLFYREIDFTTDGLFPHLLIKHGIVYILYTGLISIYILIMTFIIIYRYRHTFDNKKKKYLLFFLPLIIIPALGLGIYYTKFSHGYDTTSMAYIINSVILLLAIFRYNLFDTLDLAKDYVIENMSNGIIVLSSNNQFLYANQAAQILLSKLKETHSEPIMDYLIKWSSSRQCEFIGSQVYHCSLCDICENDISRGKMILLDDITSSYNYTKKLEKAVREKTQQLEQTQHAVISSFANMIEVRDGMTGEHVKRTSGYVQVITNALKDKGYYTETLTDSYIQDLINAAPLHDIGKISIPDSILRKPGKLNDHEFEIIKQHAKLGSEIIEELIAEVGRAEYLTIARDMAHYHHERWDGSGYPNGLCKDEIPLCARIMAISDVYDALISARSYKKGFPPEEALEIIKQGSGTQFDPIIAKVFIDSIDEIRMIHI